MIPPRTRYAVEFGAKDGVTGSNVRHLAVNGGWRGLLIEGDATEAARLHAAYADHPHVTTVHDHVYPGNIEVLFERHGVPRDLDLLSIDIDSNDYYVWRALHDFRPAVVLVEFNGSFAPPRRMVVDYHPLNHWDGSDYFGASIQSFTELGRRKGYELVYCTRNGVNLFFVERRYFDAFGLDDNAPERLYRPPQYGREHGGRAPNGRGWPPFESFTVDEGEGPVQPYAGPLVCHDVRIEKRIVHEAP